jgi:sRNA-binding carbon storage regulator CsrA
MLSLSRKPGQRILLKDSRGKEIWITATNRNAVDVFIGIDAPPDVNIVREEIIGRRSKNKMKGGNV